MKTKIIYIVLFLTLIGYTINCNNLSYENISEKILITDRFGNLIGGNLDSWCTIDTSKNLNIYPPFPNPVFQDTLNIKFVTKNLIIDANFKIYFDDGKVLFNQRQNFGGTQILQLLRSELLYPKNTLRKMTIEVNELKCEGYIQF